MRPHASAVVVAACLFALCSPAPAHAAFGSGWLERLSGPGPFAGWALGPRLLCISTPRTAAEAQAVGDALEKSVWGRRLTFPSDDNTARIYVTGAGCHFLPNESPRLEIGFERGWLHSVENVLDYSNAPGLADDDKEVRLRTLLLTADIRINRILDVGVGLGRASFSSASTPDLFSRFSRTMSQPLRVTMRPLAAFSTSKRMQAIVVRFDATKFHGRFVAEDFGAVPASFDEPGEILWSWGLRVDPFALLWR